MTQDESIHTAEDLELDASEAESVIGGAAVARFESERAAAEEIYRLSNQGYVECACIANGTMMEKNGNRIAVMYRHR